MNPSEVIRLVIFVVAIVAIAGGLLALDTLIARRASDAQDSETPANTD